MKKGKVTIGMTQFACVADRDKNMHKAEEQIREMAQNDRKSKRYSGFLCEGD